MFLLDQNMKKLLTSLMNYEDLRIDSGDFSRENTVFLGGISNVSPVFQTNTYKSVLWTQLSSQPNPR